MIKKIILGALLGLVVFSIIFVAASNVEEETTKTFEVEETCGPNSCRLECSGQCGIPSCGCRN